jgi:putative sigma-54 modulation protein
MNLKITARHFKMQDDLKAHVEEKVKKLNRYYDNILDIDLVLGWEKLNRYTEMRINVYNKQIVIKEVSDEIRKSFDVALDRAERQLKKYKDKIRKPTKEKVVTI